MTKLLTSLLLSAALITPAAAKTWEFQDPEYQALMYYSSYRGCMLGALVALSKGRTLPVKHAAFENVDSMCLLGTAAMYEVGTINTDVLATNKLNEMLKTTSAAFHERYVR